MAHEVEFGDVTLVASSAADTGSIENAATLAKFASASDCGRTRARCLGQHGAVAPLIGESTEMVAVAAHLQRIAPSSAAVMLIGESGTGKEVAAHLLHTHGARPDGPFVSVNCGAIPENLVEAELFGYERGAFTGAVRQHRGYFERASGGTLFLDEIADMPIDVQVKLLRVLESGRAIRVGGSDEITVDVRIVTATNRIPGTAVRDHRLREDLFYRLAVFLVWLPPLRQRGDDIELLADAFLMQLNRENGTAKRFDPGTLAVARTHTWPGNVRELKNCVERSYILSDDVVRLDVQPSLGVPDTSSAPSDGVHLPIGLTIAEAERKLLLATLRHCGGNKRRTADLLGVSLKTIYNKLMEYGNPYLAPAGRA